MNHVEQIIQNITETMLKVNQLNRALPYIRRKLQEDVDIEIFDEIRKILVRNMHQIKFYIDYIEVGLQESSFNDLDQARILNAIKEVRKEYNKEVAEEEKEDE